MKRTVNDHKHSAPSRAATMETLEPRRMLASHPGTGTNLDPVNYYGTAWPFADAFQTSMNWVAHSYDTITGSTTWGTGGTPQVNARGWPTQLLSWTDQATGHAMTQRLATLLFRSIGDKYPAGTYRAEWEGTGSVIFGYSAQVIQQGVQNGKNYALLNVTPGSSGILVQINSMSSADPIRNMHVWMPSYNGQSFDGQAWRPGANFSPFHPAYKQRLEPFSVLRFMDWGQTNSSTLVHWSDRPTVDDARQSTSKGVAYEYMIQLANELDDDIWVCMPHMADDDFVRNFATLVRDNLEPGRKVYIEYSNELWNGGFQQSNWIMQQMQLPENAGLTRWQMIAKETKRDFDIWSEVFQGQQGRMVRVVAGQAANSGVASQIAAAMGGSFDAIAVAPYLTPTSAKVATYTANTTGDQVASDLVDFVPTVLGWLQTHKNMANQYTTSLGRQIPLLTYEGGQHLVGNNAVYQQAYYAAQTSPLMYTAYAKLLRGFESLGGSLFMHYSHIGPNTQYGSWGALTHQLQPTSESPKYRAMVDAASGAIYEVGLGMSGSATPREGSTYTLQINSAPIDLSINSWLISWGDGTSDVFTGTLLSFNHVFADNGDYAITVTGRDLTGASLVSGSLSQAVANVAPNLVISGSNSVNVGSIYTLALQRSDPGMDTITSWLINWGDGTTQVVNGSLSSVTHQYAVAGNMTITATATDEDGTYSANSLALTVMALPSDTNKPTSSLNSAGSILSGGGTTYFFSVNFFDDFGVDITSLGNDDFLVTGPNGFSQLAKLVSVTNGTGNTRIAKYSITAPGGTWDSVDNGSYTMALLANSVRDTSGNYAAAGNVGTFSVNVLPQDTAGNTRGTSRDLGGIGAGMIRAVDELLGPSDRNDYYKFTLTTKTSVYLKLMNLTDNADLLLYDSTGKRLNYAHASGTSPEVITRTLDAGIYYIRVLYNGPQNMQYRVRTEGIAVAPGPTPIDYSELTSDVGTLMPNSPRAVNGRVSSNNDSTLTRFTVSGSSAVYIKLYELTADANIELLDSNGTVIARSSRSGVNDESLRLTLSQGTYYIRVALGAASDASFRLRLANEAAA